MTAVHVVSMLAVTAAMLVTSGCVGLAGKSGTTGTTGTSGTSTLSIDVAPSSVSFGSLTVGQSASQNLTITNSGTETLTVSGVSVAGAGFTINTVAVPMSLTAGQSATVVTTFIAGASGSASGKIMISSNAPDSPMVISLSATGVAKVSDLFVSPASLTFGNVNVGSTSTQTLQLQNSGSATLSISSVTATGSGISVEGLSYPVSIAPGASTTLTAVFKPAAAGNASGALTIASNATDSSDAVGWGGTGVAQTSLELAASPASVSFGTVSVGSTGSASIQLKNTGTASVKISAVSISGSDFTSSALTLPMTLAPNQAATLTTTFKPTSSGSFSGTVNVTSNATDSPASVRLTGTGASGALAAKPSPIAFGTVTTGATTTQMITLTNSGSAPVTISSVTTSGTPISVSGLTTPRTIAAGTSVNLTASLKLTTAGTASGAINITSNAAGSPVQISWSATTQSSVITLSSSAASLNFGSVTVGSSANQQTVIKNIGNSNASISNIAVSGTGFVLSGSGSGATLTPGQSLTLTVTFDPTAAGSDTGTLAIMSNASNSQLGVALAGTAVKTSAPATTPSVGLSWDASTSSIVGYYVYRSSKPNGPYTRLNSSSTPGTSYADGSVSGGQVYYYVVTAVNSSNIESTDSNQVSATVPQ